MASAKASGTTRRSSGGSKSPKKGSEPEISPARWAGVAFVIAAIVAAIALAMISPSEAPPITGEAEEPSPSPTPTPTTTDTRLPEAQPKIVSPLGGPTAEYEIAVVVDIPDEALPKRKLTLVVFRDGEEQVSMEKPQTGGRETVPGIRLLKDVENELTVALEGPGGYGPLSDPVVITHDSEAPILAITEPENKKTTYKSTILVAGTSEPGAEVTITNEANDHEVPVVVGNAGTFKTSVQLKRGVNRIVVRAVDAAGVPQSDAVKVQRFDGRPYLKLTAPAKVKRNALPTTIKVVVEVTDVDGDKMEGAEVHFSLGGPGRITVTQTDVTGANGRAVWNPEVTTSNALSSDTLDLSVTVTSPQGETRVKDKAISIS